MRCWPKPDTRRKVTLTPMRMTSGLLRHKLNTSPVHIHRYPPYISFLRISFKFLLALSLSLFLLYLHMYTPSTAASSRACISHTPMIMHVYAPLKIHDISSSLFCLLPSRFSYVSIHPWLLLTWLVGWPFNPLHQLTWPQHDCSRNRFQSRQETRNSQKFYLEIWWASVVMTRNSP